MASNYTIVFAVYSPTAKSSKFVETKNSKLMGSSYSRRRKAEIKAKKTREEEANKKKSLKLPKDYQPYKLPDDETTRNRS